MHSYSPQVKFAYSLLHRIVTIFCLIGGNRIVIVDFSFPASVLENWMTSGVEIVVLAHHKTAQEFLSRIANPSLTRSSRFLGFLLPASIAVSVESLVILAVRKYVSSKFL